MKKIVKISLVTAMATAGLTTANAKPLTEAIKDVDISGTVVYRYNDLNDEKSVNGSSTTNNYKIGLNVSSKVNDDVKVHTRIIADGFGMDTQASSDKSIDVDVRHVYFSYTGLKNTTFNIGKQGLATPWTMAIDSDGLEQTGAGIFALSTWGPVTLTGGYFNQTNTDVSNGGFGDYKIALDGSSNLYVAGIVGNMGPVTLDAWYFNSSEGVAQINGTATAYDGIDSFTIGANANFQLAQNVKLGFDARYTDLSFDTDGLNDYNKDNSIIDIQANLKAGIFDATAVYAVTDNKGGLTAIDSSAPTTYSWWYIDMNGKADADMYMLGAGVQVLKKLHIALNYTNLEWDSNGSANKGVVEEDELYTQITYKMSSNLSSYVRFGTYNVQRDGDDTVDINYNGRLQIEYFF